MNFLETCRKIAKKAGKLVMNSSTKEVSQNELGQMTMEVDLSLENCIIDELKKFNCAILSEEIGKKEFSKMPEVTFLIDPLDGSENYKKGIPVYAFGIAKVDYGGRIDEITEAYVYDLARGEEFYAAAGKGCLRNGRKVQASKVNKLDEALVSVDFYADYSETRLRPETVGKLVSRARDIRRFGPDLLDMSYTASGSLDAFVEITDSLSIIHASGFAILRETCIVTDEYGERVEKNLEEITECMNIVASGSRKLHDEIIRCLNAKE
ncbi:hypothetical protein HY570_01515 [Candidatus Micrarchaeota archaeon]|nr:hypothetical protein [Candidatus Micrarchaeota archaeon]